MGGVVLWSNPLSLLATGCLAFFCRTCDKASVTLVNKLEYIEDVTTRESIMLALQVAVGRLRMALATSR